MARIGDLVAAVRSKNAGPFWVTIDIFCEDRSVFESLSTALSTDRVAARLGVATESVRRFDIRDLNAIKLSVPRPVTQGSRFDRDMHGAQWAVLLAELEVNV